MAPKKTFAVSAQRSSSSTTSSIASTSSASASALLPKSTPTPKTTQDDLAIIHNASLLSSTSTTATSIMQRNNNDDNGDDDDDADGMVISEPEIVDSSEMKHLKVLSFAKHRVFELVNLADAIEARSGSKRIFQQLPRYRRRRAMSYNIHLLPRHFRSRAQRELDLSAVQPPKGKKNARKLKRQRTRKFKIKDSQNEVNPDSNVLKRLDTHVWHSKRFEMVQLWGFSLADTSYLKNFRPSYRFTSYECTLYDASYYYVIKLAGPQEMIISALRHLVGGNHRENSPFSKRGYLSGTRHAPFLMYRNDSNRCIGLVDLLWRQEADIDGTDPTQSRQLYLWIHPAAFSESLIHLRLAVDQVNRLHDSKLSLVESKRRDFARFELRGPHSNRVLGKVLTAYVDQVANNASKKNCFTQIRKLRTPATLPEGIVLCLTITKPISNNITRNIPKSNLQPRRPPHPASSSSSSGTADEETLLSMLSEWPNKDAALSTDLWKPHDEGKDTATPTPNEQNKDEQPKKKKRKTSQTTPSVGTTTATTAPTSQSVQEQAADRPQTVTFEILLLQQPSHLSRGFASGWDVVLRRNTPSESKWSNNNNTTWLWRAMAGTDMTIPLGLRDRGRMILEQGVARFPFDYPDTDAFSTTQEKLRQILQEKVDRHPRKLHGIAQQQHADQTDAKMEDVSSSFQPCKNIDHFFSPSSDASPNNGIAEEDTMVGVVLLFHAKEIAPDNMPKSRIYFFETARQHEEFEQQSNIIKQQRAQGNEPSFAKQLVVGYVHDGIRSLVRGKAEGVGFIRRDSIAKILQAPQSQVFVESHSTEHAQPQIVLRPAHVSLLRYL